MNNEYVKQLKEFEQSIDKLSSPEDILNLNCDLDCKFKVAPNSVTYETGYKNFGKPFYIQLDEVDLGESVATALTLEQAIELRDFLDNKIKLLQNL